MAYQFRTADASDVGALIALSHRTISACYRSFLGDAAVDSFLDSGAAAGFVRANLLRTHVIACDGRVAGLAVCRQNLVELILIAPEFQGRGLGGALLGHVEALLFHEHPVLRLESFAENAAANAFYRRHGWVETDRRFDSTSGFEKVAFEKSSSSA